MVKVPAALGVVAAPKLKPDLAVLLLPPPAPESHGVTAVPFLEVVADLLSLVNSRD